MKSYIFKLLRLLDTESFLSSNELARKIGKSPKTIQKQVEKLNDDLKGIAHIESKMGKGYRLIKINEAAFVEFCSQYPNVSKDVMQRRHHILTLLLTNKAVKVGDLAQDLYINEKTVSNDLKEIRQLLDEFKLRLISRPYYGLSLVGDEEHIRFFILRHQLNLAYDFSYKERCALYDYLSKFNFSPIYLYNIEKMFGISVERIRLGYVISSYKGIVPDNDLIELIEQYGWGGLAKQELGFLTHYVHRLQKKQETVFNEKDIKYGLYLIEETFGLKLADDTTFFEKIMNHLTALKRRMDSNIYITNPLLEDIRKNLALEYNIARHFSSWLYEQFHMQLSADELGFLAIIFALVTTKLKARRKSILIVSNLNANSYQLLESTYYHLFGEYVEKIESCSPQELLVKSIDEYDHIIAINGLPTMYDMTSEKIKSVPYFLNNRDEETIKLLFSNTEKLSFNTLLDDNLFFVEEQKIDNLEAYIEQVCQRIDDYTQQHVSQKIMERYQLGATQMGKKSVFLHPIGKGRETYTPFIAVIVLKHPVFWDFSKVSFLFIVSLPSINNTNRHIYDSLSTFMLDDELIDTYKKNATFEQLKNLLTHLEEEKCNG